MPIFLIIIVSILVGTSYYLAHRLHRGLACFFPKLKFVLSLVLVGSLTLFLVLGFGRSMLPFPDAIKESLEAISGYCMGVVLYFLMFTVIADIMMLVLQLTKHPLRRHPLIHGITTAGVLLLTCITCIFGFIHGGQLHHVSYEINLQGKQDISDLNVVLISDVHLGSLGSEEKLGKIVDEINSLNPDIICIAGDFFDTDFASIHNPKAAIETLKRLNSTYGVYASLGNHDAGATHSQMVAFLTEANITLLQDTFTMIDERLVIVGRLDGSPIGSFGDKKRQELASFFTREDPTLPVIVLDHNPARIDEYSSEADLVLCGHTHKGQVFPGSIITNAMYTVDYGYYQKDANSPHVIVTSGVGSWGMPMRVGSDCEIVSIQFTHESQK